MFTPLMPSPPSLRAPFAHGLALRGAWVVAMTFAGLASNRAEASPAVDGVRNLSLGSVGRASAFGSSAALLNPSNMSMEGVFTIEPTYQFGIQSRTHGLGAVTVDSLLNSRVSVGMGYLFMRGSPQISYFDTEREARRDMRLSLFGHEAFLAISIAPVKRWVSIALKGKWQYSSLRYLDSDGDAKDAHDKLNAFGLDASVTINFANWAAIAVTSDNLVGNHAPSYTDSRAINLTGLPVLAGSIQHERLSELSGYPLLLGHGLAVFPLRNRKLSVNFDGTYDFTTFRFEKHTRLTYGGSAEFIAGPVPIRFGTVWDNRGKGRDDDRVFIAAGVGFLRQAKAGAAGLDIGFGFRQQVVGPQKETVLGINIGIRMQPEL